MTVPEAPLVENRGGLVPESDGWFVVNVRDAEWGTGEKFGSGCRFESPEHEFPQLGINLRVVEPGQPACLYHRESNQEDFLVLFGECVLLIEGEERPLRTWDFVHCPQDTEHVFVGAGDGPCVILMTGARSTNEEIVYPESEVARRYGASAETTTDSPAEAYAPFARRRPGRPASWGRLPWA
jgi:uncharacterized cupin superfamily protein